MEDKALEYVKKWHYSHVIVEDDWYRKTAPYRAYLQGWHDAIEEAKKALKESPTSTWREFEKAVKS